MFPPQENNQKQGPWNKGKLVGQKPPLKLKEIWEIRIRLQIDKKHRDLALFNLAIDSKLRACDPLKLRVSDVSQGNRIASRAAVVQQKTSQSVQFEITEQTRQAVLAWIQQANLSVSNFLFPSRLHQSPHLSTRQYARIVESWVVSIGLNAAAYGTHSMRRTKASVEFLSTRRVPNTTDHLNAPRTGPRPPIDRRHWRRRGGLRDLAASSLRAKCLENAERRAVRRGRSTR